MFPWVSEWMWAHETGLPSWRRDVRRHEDGSWNWKFLGKFIYRVTLAQDLCVHLEIVSLRTQDTHVCNILGCQGVCFIHIRRADFALSWMCECSIVVHLVLCGFSFHISLFPTVATGTTGAARSSARDLEKLEWFNRQKHCDSLHLSDIYHFSVHFIGQLINHMGLY